MYKTLLKPLLFSLSPEKAHHFTVKLLSITTKIPGLSNIFKGIYAQKGEHLKRELFGLSFKNSVGLAAGFDKDGKYFKQMENIGFGFIEIGTVTPKPQVGNPQPRLFRLPKDEALINRMGFNNEGVDALVERLKKYKKTDLIIGGNIGKNKTTPNEKAIDDYDICFKKLFPYVDYFVINVSSPNTPNLRALQDKDPLTKLLSHVQNLNLGHQNPKPIFLKIAPDLSNGQLDDIISIVREVGITGIIATNTTIERSNLQTNQKQIESIGNGGLSGKPIGKRSTDVIAYLYKNSRGQIPIIGVGGIRCAQDAQDKINAGACLVQVYSGLVYEGPSLVKRILKEVNFNKK